ncbi:MAG: hypothetical protein KatS3mg078_1198 [Deltaproteobacteria bacterium]|jgi:hypothetical protein|nr:MAG: hypothetical protein KatS3mg078_1198 [Deltaproteobacteria bacterium]
MKNMKSGCHCGSGKRAEECCYRDASVVDLTQYRFDQAERELRIKLVDFSHRPEIQAQLGEAFYIWKNDPELSLADLSEEDIDDQTFERFFDWFIFDFKLLDSGKRLLERFYEEYGETLSDTERAILKDWMGNTYSFFEVEEIIEKEGCYIRDIFTGEVVQVKDSSASNKLSRMDIIGARLLKTGNNVYFSGVISVYPQAFKALIIDFVSREFKEYKKTFGRKRTYQEYLKDWGYLIGQYIEDIVKKPKFLTSEGDELIFASAIYEISDYNKVLNRLRKIKTLNEISGGTDELRVFSWITKGKHKLSGTIELEKDRLTIEGYSLSLLAKAKDLIERKLHGLVTHREDRIKEFESLPKSPTSETQKVKKLPFGVKSSSELDTILDEYYDKWIDTPLQILEGKTPREALKTKKGREKLEYVLRELENVYQHAKERGEPYYDVEKLRKKLRLE